LTSCIPNSNSYFTSSIVRVVRVVRIASIVSQTIKKTSGFVLPPIALLLEKKLVVVEAGLWLGGGQ